MESEKEREHIYPQLGVFQTAVAHESIARHLHADLAFCGQAFSFGASLRALTRHEDALDGADEASAANRQATLVDDESFLETALGDTSAVSNPSDHSCWAN